MPHENSNVIHLSRFHRQVGEPFNDTASEEVHCDPEHASELQAIASCLDYLYVELRKLDQSMSAHLIGAAAECLRQEVYKCAQDE